MHNAGVRLFRAPVANGLLAAALVFGWQALTVRFNYHGNWTALFCTGGLTPVPPAAAHEALYRFPGSTGYDGQFYHFIAHDPFFQRGVDKFVDSARLRYRRILVPLLAWVAAAGRDRYIDVALLVLTPVWVFLGVFWLSRYAAVEDLHPAWGLAFLLLPAAIISVDRFTVDVTLLACAAGFLLYATIGPGWKLYLVLLGAVLTRETGVLLLAGYGLFLAWKRLWRRAFIFATVPLPPLAWFLFVHSRTAGYEANIVPRFPAEAILWRIIEPIEYALPKPLAWTAVALDYLAFAGTGLAIILGARFALQKAAGPVELSGLLFSVLSVALGNIVGWWEPFGHPRTFSPLYLFFGVRAVRSRAWVPALPLLMSLPRIGLQLGPQILGILRGIVSGSSGE